MSKKRLDLLLVGRGFFESRERARSAVMSGTVYVNGQKADKPGTVYPCDAGIETRDCAPRFVSRGGLKLQKALSCFGIAVKGLNALDAGASTGGFTDCLLQNGASKVWAVDVGYGQLDWRLRNDPRVVCVERTNARNISPEHLGGETAGMAALDLSFISLSLVLPAVRRVTADGAPAVCLVKPQFEAGRDKVGKGGVVKSPDTHREVLQSHILAAEAAGFVVKGITFSPIKGPKGNIEFLSHLEAGASAGNIDIDPIVDAAHKELL